MIELKINPKFRDVLPKITEAERNKLAESVIAEGCHDPLIVWNNVIVDGHNRYEICRENNVSFDVKEIEFGSDDEVYLWICLHQLARRNLHPSKRTEVLGRYLELRKKGVGAPKGNKNAAKNRSINVTPLISEPKKTAAIIADEQGVSTSTVEKAGQYVKALDELPEEEKELARAGEISQKEVIQKAAELKDKTNGSKPIVRNKTPKRTKNEIALDIILVIDSIAIHYKDGETEYFHGLPVDNGEAMDLMTEAVMKLI